MFMPLHTLSSASLSFLSSLSLSVPISIPIFYIILSRGFHSREWGLFVVTLFHVGRGENQEIGSLGFSLSLIPWGAVWLGVSHFTSLERSHLSKTGFHTRVTVTLQEHSQGLCLGGGDLSALVKNVKHNSNAEDYCYPLREGKPQSSALTREIRS